MKLQAKFVLGLVLIALIGFTSCKNGTKSTQSRIVFDTVTYSVNIFNPELNNSWDRYTDGNIETSKRKAFLEPLFKDIDSGRIEVYDYKTFAAITKEAVKNIVTTEEKITLPSKENPEVMEVKTIRNKISLSDITSIIFKEVWTLDTVNRTFSKKVIAFCPVLNKYRIDSTGANVLYGNTPLFWIKTQKLNSSVGKLITESINNIQISTKIENANSAFVKISPVIIAKINKYLLSLAKKDTANIYNYIDLSEKLPYSEFKNKFTSTTTITFKSKVNPEIDSVIRKEYTDYNNLDGVGFSENWSYDSKNQCFIKDVKALSIWESMYIINPETGEQELKGFMFKFAMKMN